MQQNLTNDLLKAYSPIYFYILQSPSKHIKTQIKMEREGMT